MGNRKAISSDDFFNNYEKDQEIKDKFKEL